MKFVFPAVPVSELPERCFMPDVINTTHLYGSESKALASVMRGANEARRRLPDGRIVADEHDAVRFLLNEIASRIEG